MSPFAAPLGLLGLLAVPVVFLLHRLRRRLRERRVAGLFLFAPDTLSAGAGRTVSPLLRTASLWLEVAAAVALGCALALPSGDVARRAPHVVVVLDDSASMSAVAEGRAAADRGRDAVRARLDGLPRDATVTLVLTGTPPVLLVGPRAARADVGDALARWRPTRGAHDPAAALALAAELAEPGAGVWFVTDADAVDVPPRVEVLAVGRALDGAAIAGARRFRDGDVETVLLDVVAYARGPFATSVSVRVGRGDRWDEVARRAIVVSPDRPTTLTLAVPASDLDVRVALDDDPLALDGDVVLLPEPPRTVPFALAAAPATVARLGLDRLDRALDGVVASDEASAALVIADHEAPVARGVTRVVIAPAGDERDDWLGPFLLDRAHPLAAGLTLDGVVWTAGRGPLRGRGIVFAGEQALLAEETSPVGTVVRVNLDAARASVPAAADWPILWSNVVERVRTMLPGPAAVNLKLGETLAYRATPGDGDLGGWRLVAPSGASEALGDGPWWTAEPTEVGVHRLVAPRGELARFSVAFVDARESDLRDRGEGVRPSLAGGAIAVDAPVAYAGAGAWVRGLALAVLALAVADVWVLRRRPSRQGGNPA